MARYKLGRNPSPRHDLDRRLRLKHFLDAGYIGAVPASVSYTPTVADLPIFANDRLSDCTAAGVAHLVTAFSQFGQGQRFVPAESDVIKFYSGSTGYRPGYPSTDQGGDMLTVLKYWQKTGLAGHKIAAYFAVDPTDVAEMRAAVWLFGNLFVGVHLPKSAEDAFDRGEVWDYVPNSKDLGGHLVAGHAVEDSDRIVISTWGGLAEVTPAFMAHMADEIYTVVTQEWIKNNVSPPGLDVAAINAAYRQVTGRQGPFRTDDPGAEPAAESSLLERIVAWVRRLLGMG